jgi:uncharacterized RDD family membrane protein YckC
MVYVQGSVDVRVTGRRIVATILDGIVLGLVYRALTGMFHTTYTSNLDFTRLTSKAGIGWLIFAILYYVLLEGLFGRTVGKAVTGIKVISADTGAVPGMFSALVRTLTGWAATCSPGSSWCSATGGAGWATWPAAPW